MKGRILGTSLPDQTRFGVMRTASRIADSESAAPKFLCRPVVRHPFPPA